MSIENAATAAQQQFQGPGGIARHGEVPGYRAMQLKIKKAHSFNVQR